MAACPIEVLVIMAVLCPTMGSAVAIKPFEGENGSRYDWSEGHGNPWTIEPHELMHSMEYHKCTICPIGYSVERNCKLTSDTSVRLYDGFSMGAFQIIWNGLNQFEDFPPITNWKVNGETLPSTTLPETGTNPWQTYAFYTLVAVCILAAPCFVVYHCYVKRRLIRGRRWALVSNEDMESIRRLLAEYLGPQPERMGVNITRADDDTPPNEYVTTTPYGRMKNALASEMTTDDCSQIHLLLDIRPGEAENANDGPKLLALLERMDKFSEGNVDKLIDIFNEVEMTRAAGIVIDYKAHNLSVTADQY